MLQLRMRFAPGLLIACMGSVNLQQQGGQAPPQQQQFNQPPPPGQQQQFNQPPPPQQQQFNQPPPPPQQQQMNQPPPPQQQQMNQPPPPQQQQFKQPPPPQQQQFKQPPPPPQQFNQQGQPMMNQPPPPGQQQQFAPPPGQQFAQQPPPPQGQRFAPGVAPPQQVRMAPGVPPPQQQQQARMAGGVPPQQQQLPPGVSPQQFAAMQQQQQMQQQQVRLPPGVPPQQQQGRMAPGVPPPAGGQVQLPPGVSPQQFAAMQAQQQQGGQGVPQPQYPPGHAVNIAPPTPPPPPADASFDSSNWLDSAPGIAMEYKVHVEAGKEDCYWQFVHTGATLYVSYQVLKGGDGAIGMAVRNPAMTVVHPYAWKASSEYEESDIVSGGYYSVCLDNQFSRFSAKLVNLYITTFRYDEWEKFSQELQDMDVTVENFTSTLRSVDQRIQVMRQFQSMSRGGEARDFNLIQDNLSYVQTWSMAQIVVVILCTVIQVNFVKSLFKDPRDSSKSAGSGFKMRT
eukprot:GFUD01014584.1.p2 GENE.GFUD01014584.1~~GFUD01014584.1.p2  ORF type:complete len:509 (+),score=171.21 GFUD01014584.1:474-2000(+)